MCWQGYGLEIDISNVGVILYILLAGVPPFWEKLEQGIFYAILCGHVDYTSDPWPSISSGAKDLVKNMLRQDPKKHFKAIDILNNSWMREDGEAPDKPLDTAIFIVWNLLTTKNGIH